MLEVEQKFVVSPSIVDSLVRIGASLIKEAVIHDIYYDNENHKLMESDHWLRVRNGQWQLKYPTKKLDCSAPSRESCATMYYDVEDMEIILSKVVPLLNAEIVSRKDLEQLVEEKHLMPVLDFTSHRRTFTCSDGCSVDLDVTDFGFSVGEIEKLVDDESQVSSAQLLIEELAAKLGKAPESACRCIVVIEGKAMEDFHSLTDAFCLALQPSTFSICNILRKPEQRWNSFKGVTEKVRQGKIDAYLALRNPTLLEKLRNAGVLQKP